MHNIHCNGIGQIFSKNLSQNQRFCGETELFRLTYSIIKIYRDIRIEFLDKMHLHCLWKLLEWVEFNEFCKENLLNMIAQENE